MWFGPLSMQSLQFFFFLIVAEDSSKQIRPVAFSSPERRARRSLTPMDPTEGEKAPQKPLPIWRAISFRGKFFPDPCFKEVI